MKSLTDIANAYGTDKGTIGPSDAFGGHNYTDVYDAYLWPMRDQPIQLLEIGIGVTGDAWDAQIVVGRNSGGASLKMWYDYFPRGQLVGLDVNSGAQLDNERISTFIVDQGDSEALRAVCRGYEFDIVVDDGSHRPDHQQISLGTIWPYLKSGGFYIIEDLTSNGSGDRGSGRNYSSSVLNTRSVIRSFTESGRFADPHLIGDAEQVGDSIEFVRFHCPMVSTSVRLSRLRRYTGRLSPPVVRLRYKFRPGTEMVCVIRKR